MNVLKIRLLVLKAKICGLQALSMKLGREARSLSGSRRAALNDAKRQIGVYTRHHLLAYALLRGKTYKEVEKCTRNRPSPLLLQEIVQDHGVRKEAHLALTDAVTFLEMFPSPQPKKSIDQLVAEKVAQSPTKPIQKRISQ